MEPGHWRSRLTPSHTRELLIPLPVKAWLTKGLPKLRSIHLAEQDVGGSKEMVLKLGECNLAHSAPLRSEASLMKEFWMHSQTLSILPRKIGESQALGEYSLVIRL